MAEKKISFGFSKLKKPALLPGASVKKPEVQLIQCLEGQAIKIVGHSAEEEKPLVIPLIGNTKTSAALAALKKLKNTIDGVDEPEPESTPAVVVPVADGEQLTLEQKAAREILISLQQSQTLDGAADDSLVLKLTSDQLPLDGAKESTMDDYDSIPIESFGKAMLRGMGWKDEPKDGKSKDKSKTDGPVLRPKGMGLGADKMIKAKPLLVAPAQGEVLSIRKGASVRLLSGKHKDLYGTIESMDDHAGRILVKMAVGPAKEWLNEFMVQPVSKEEYSKYAKVINSAKYEEYKIMQDQKLAMQKIKMEKEDVPLTAIKDESRREAHVISDSDSERDYRRNDRRSRSLDRKPGNNSSKSHKDERPRPVSPEWGAPSIRRQSRSDDEDRQRRDRSSKQYDDRDRQNPRNSDRVESSRKQSDSTSRKDESKSSRSRHRSSSRSVDRTTSRKPSLTSRRDDRRNRSSSPDSVHETERKKSHKKSSKHKSSHKKKSKSRRRSRSSSRSNSSSDSDNNVRSKKKTKKSKRERSRSRQR